MTSKPIAIFIAAAALTFAQGPRGPQPNNPQQHTGTGLDMAKVQTIEGAVTAVNAGYGVQYPSIQVNQTTVKIAPVWYMLENDFEVESGDKLKVVAAPSLQARDPYLSAVSITNTVSGATLALRDSAGIPLWTKTQNGNGSHEGPATCTGCAGPSLIATVSGVVDQVTAGIGIQMPSFVLKTSDGKVLTVKIGPERVLSAADFEIKAGDSLTVRYAVTCTDETVALELTNASGAKLVLRKDDGTPAWR